MGGRGLLAQGPEVTRSFEAEYVYKRWRWVILHSLMKMGRVDGRLPLGARGKGDNDGKGGARVRGRGGLSRQVEGRDGKPPYS